MARYHIPKHGKRQQKGKKQKSKNVETVNYPRYEDMMEGLDYDANYRLHVAVICCIPELVESLLVNKRKADPNLALKCGITPLHCIFLARMPNHEYEGYPLCKYNLYDKYHRRDAGTIIDTLVRSGSRLLPDSYGLTPLSIAVWTRNKGIGYCLVNTVSCRVDDVIHYENFSMPRSDNLVPAHLPAHRARLRRALLLHVKHGATPHQSPGRQFLSCVSDTELSSDVAVFSSQLSSYLALCRVPGKDVFSGVKFLLDVCTQNQKVNNEPENLEDYVALVNTLVSWLNSSDCISKSNVFEFWHSLIDCFLVKEVRENMHLLSPGFVTFLYKFILPTIEQQELSMYDSGVSRTVRYVILFLKLISDSTNPTLIQQHEMQEIFRLFNRKHLVLPSLYCPSHTITKWYSLERFELLDFAMCFTFNLNEYIHGNGGTVLHLAAATGEEALIRYFLQAGVSPQIKDLSGNTFLSILRMGRGALYERICREFDLGPPYRLMTLCANVYIQYRLPLRHFHRHKLLKEFVIKHCTRQECKQMCSHCYKEYYT